MRVSAVITAMFVLLTALGFGACDSENCLECVDCPDFTGDYAATLTVSEDTCDGTAYAVGNTEIPALTAGQMDVYLTDQDVSSIGLRIIQEEISAELSGILCTPEESGGYSININGIDNTFTEVTVYYSFSGGMVNTAEDEQTDGGVPLPEVYELQGYFSADYTNNTDLDQSCRVAGQLETFSY